MQKLFNIMIVPILSYGGHFGHFLGGGDKKLKNQTVYT